VSRIGSSAACDSTNVARSRRARYLRLINPHDDVSFRRVVNVARGIGKSVMEALR
jgi:hypothetical protein